MSLTSGQLIAHYRIDRKIGEGGMGEVWAATDTRLNRSAAIKALPASVAADPERLGRFKREAQLLAALSHPNIAAIYGLEQVDETPFLALELVEGDDLSTRIEGRPVPVDETIEIALQIAAALEEAHEKGIVHRDLKPANIKLTPDGKVKVLDFGLAKALSADPESSGSLGAVELSASPTMTAAMGTQAGLILGTAPYMAPEQARGKSVDRRADIWAFGVILFEMLTGERLHVGETVTDVIASVVTRTPDWDKLPAGTPAATRRLLRRCLQKDPRKRLRDIGDAALELAEGSQEPSTSLPSDAAPTPPVSARRPWLIGLAGLVLGLVVAMAIQTAMTPAPVLPTPTWSSIAPPRGAEFAFTKFLEISPDGRKVVFVATPEGGDEPMMWIRELSSEQPRALTGTEGAEQPFWSPDSRSIGYFADSKLRVIDVDGGVARTLADSGDGARGGSWGADDTILFVPGWSQPVSRVSASGGPTEVVTELNKERLELSHRWPHLLPDGKHFLFFVVSTYPELNPENPSEVDKSGLYIGSLEGDPPRLLQTARSRAVYKHGSLLFVDDGVLMARPFDLDSLSFAGDSVTIAEGVTQSVDALWGGALFSVSDEGTLLFVRGAPERRARSQMRWYDRAGKLLGAVGDPEPFNSLKLSPDGSRVATSIGDPADLWLYDIGRGGSTRFTFDPGYDAMPIWSPGGDQILFESSRIIPGQPFVPGNLFRKAASGVEEEEHLASVELGPSLMPSDWSADGEFVAFSVYRPGTGADIMLYSTADGSITPYLATERDHENARFSPDGRWVAFVSHASDRFEIHVQPFPGPGGKWQVSTDGGTRPFWNPDGTELFYLEADNTLMSVKVSTEGGFRHETPKPLFVADLVSTRSGNPAIDISPDGKRFLLLGTVEEDGTEPASVTLLQGWRGLAE